MCAVGGGMKQNSNGGRNAAGTARRVFTLRAALGVFVWLAATGRGFAAGVDFGREIRPVLAEHCFQCHGPDEPARKAKLRLDTREGLFSLREGGRVVVAGKPEESVLFRRITATNSEDVMPPVKHNKPLPARQVALLREWIAQGAAWQQHWAFVAPVRPALPPVRRAEWVRNGIDAFVLARLERENLSPAREAERATLVRRVTLDLTGLPPTPEEAASFVADARVDAFERLVERLLASPRFGEHVARAWLDAARYADTNGYNNDEERTMWAWRDWVIQALNANLPFDRFLTEQLAGDLLPNATLRQKIATGFNRNHVLTTEGGIIEEEYRVEYVADRVHTMATAFLGLTMQCARCHDHKFDPISQRDYYRMFAFFNGLPDRVVGYNTRKAAAPFLATPTATQESELRLLREKVAALDARLLERKGAARGDAAKWEANLSVEEIAGLAKSKTVGGGAAVLERPAGERTAAQREQLEKYFLESVDMEFRRLTTERAALAKQAAASEDSATVTMVMQEAAEKRTAFLLRRGQYDQRGDAVEAGVPENLPPLPPGAPRNRLGLAQWLTAPEHPLTARVAVNRWWEGLFGSGLVETVEDFGAQGALPSHPELLDWLATELQRTGWDVKGMFRLIVTSATYRQSAAATLELVQRDPAGRLLARSPRFRLAAEMIRDQALAVAGLLGAQVGGPSVKPYQPAGLWEDVSVERKYSYVPDAGEGLYRRSLYTFWKRTCPPPGMTTLDAPDRETCVMRRARTSTPLQALLLLNDPTYVEAARKLAERVLRDGGGDDAARTRWAYQLVLARAPQAREAAVVTEVRREALERFRREPEAAKKLLGVGKSPRVVGTDEVELAAWTTVASLLLNLDETLNRP